tara:strand:+ start:218 stop:808 length:591 start_codon:yes stop_codon:yes gene_type:complete
MDGVTSIIAALITAAATLFSVWLGRRYINRKEKDCIVKETVQNANVYMALKFIIGETDADRVYVMEFHNGEHYFSGRGQQKFSCTYEVVSDGISIECENSQNHRVSNYHEYISEMINDNRFAYRDMEEIHDRAFLKLAKGKGVKSIYNIPIKTLNGKIIGILGIDYVKSDAPEDIRSEEKFKFMKRQARIISGYLI